MQGYLIARALPAAELEAMICLLTPRMTSISGAVWPDTTLTAPERAASRLSIQIAELAADVPLGDACAFETADL